MESILPKELKFYPVGVSLRSSGKQSTVPAYGCKDDLLQTCKRFDYWTEFLLDELEISRVRIIRGWSGIVFKPHKYVIGLTRV